MLKVQIGCLSCISIGIFQSLSDTKMHRGKCLWWVLSSIRWWCLEIVITKHSHENCREKESIVIIFFFYNFRMEIIILFFSLSLSLSPWQVFDWILHKINLSWWMWRWYVYNVTICSKFHLLLLVNFFII